MPNPYNFQNYGNPFGGSVTPVGNPYVNQAQPLAQNNPIIWVQGEEGAKNYPVAAGQTVLLMDQTSNVFYLKTTDISGIPQPLRVFDYIEREEIKDSSVTTNDVAYVTKREFDELKTKLDQLVSQRNDKKRFDKRIQNGE